jgi:hypothetical protein
MTLLNDANGGNVVYRVRENPDDLQHPRGGLFGGSIDSLKPRVYLPKGYSVVPKLAPGFYVGERAFVENIAGDRMYSLETGAVLMTIPHPPEDSDLFYTLYHFHDNDLFWIADSSARTLIKSWTASGGTKTLIGYPSDFTRAVDAFGTDGVDMAWMEASGRMQGAKIFSTVLHRSSGCHDDQATTPLGVRDFLDDGDQCGGLRVRSARDQQANELG